MVLVDPLAQDIRKRISNYWVGDINNNTDVRTIPSGIEGGIEKLKSILRE